MIEREHPSPEALTDYAHGELPAADDARVHAHLSGCADCAEAYDGELRLGEILRAHARMEERELPPGLTDAIFANVAGSAPSWWDRIVASLRPAIALPVAAAVVLALYFTLSTHGTARATTIDASYYLEDHAELANSVPFDDESAAPAMLTSDDGAAGERAVDEAH